MTEVLLVEDNDALNLALAEVLRDADFQVTQSYSAEEALQVLSQKSFGLIVSDIKMPGISGYEFLEKIKKLKISSPVLLMTAFGTIDKAVQALKMGANDYLTKPFDLDSFISKVKEHCVNQTSNGPIMASRLTQETFEIAKKVALTDVPVLIQGESGTGKEVLAKFIHRESSRKDKQFVAINCAAIPDNMLEATLFGYDKGAFTGAYQSTSGKFEQANGGTLLLDEISEMPISLQAKILRVLQEKEVERIGSKKIIPLDVRILATTNKVLSQEVKEGRFREDLYFRLNVFPITWHPLRQRKEDIEPLVMRTIQASGRTIKLNDAALQKLNDYEWPGNIRELDNVIQRALILSNDSQLKVENLIFEKSELYNKTTQDLSENLAKQEYQVICDVLAQTKGNRQKTAELLGISPRTLRYKMAKMKQEGVIPDGETL